MAVLYFNGFITDGREDINVIGLWSTNTHLQSAPNTIKNQNDDVSSDFLFVNSVKVSNRVRLFRRRALEALPATGFH